MKNKYKCTFALILVLFFNCKKSDSTGGDSLKNNISEIKVKTSNPISDNKYHLNNESFDNWLKINLTEKEVFSKIKNNFKDSIYISEVDGYEIKECFSKDLGLKLFFQINSNNKKLSQIEIKNPSSMKTSRGVGIGDNKEFVNEKYNGLINKNDSDFETVVIGDVYNGIFFIFKNNKVDNIILGSLAE